MSPGPKPGLSVLLKGKNHRRQITKIPIIAPDAEHVAPTTLARFRFRIEVRGPTEINKLS